MLQITVGHSDYKSIMRILNQNLQEGQPEVKPQQSVPKTMSKTAVKSQTSREPTKTKSAEAVVTSKDSKKPRTTVKFSFTMASFEIDLLSTTYTVSITDLKIHKLSLFDILLRYTAGTVKKNFIS